MNYGVILRIHSFGYGTTKTIYFQSVDAEFRGFGDIQAEKVSARCADFSRVFGCRLPIRHPAVHFFQIAEGDDAGARAGVHEVAIRNPE